MIPVVVAAMTAARATRVLRVPSPAAARCFCAVDAAIGQPLSVRRSARRLVGDQETWYGTGSTGGAQTGTVTVTLSNANNVVGAAIQEFSGVATTNPLDGTATNTGSGSTTVTTPAVTTTTAGDLVYDSANTDDLVTEPAGTPWTNNVGFTSPGGNPVTTQTDYIRDATGRVIERRTVTDGSLTSDVYYTYPDDSDTPNATLDEVTNYTTYLIGLPGGAQITALNGLFTWSYPDLHGDMVVTANQAGNQTGTTASYDPFGDLVTPTSQFDAYTYGYEGKHDVGTDNTTPITLIEMGQRVYSPALGRFLQVDPIPGSSANNYDYAYQDPINSSDLSGDSPPRDHYHHLTITRTHPYVTSRDENGLFRARYNYQTRSLQFSMKFSAAASAGFGGRDVVGQFQVYVNGLDTSYHYEPHTEPASYLFHSSLTTFAYKGESTSQLLEPGDSAQITFEAANENEILGEQDQVYVAP
jgi:RHS repeat-associated protein